MAVTVSHGTDDSQHSSSSKKNTVRFDFMTMRAYVLAVLSQLQGRVTLDTVRPLPLFLGVSGSTFCLSPEAFTPPVKKLDKATPEKFKSRLKLNFAFFLSNYALLAAGVSLVIALMHPGMLIAVSMLWMLWSFHNFLISNEFILFGHNIGTLVSITHRSAILTAITILVVVWKCLVPVILSVTISSFLIFTHAVMRDPKHINTSGELRRESDDEGTSSDSEVLVERPAARRDVV